MKKRQLALTLGSLITGIVILFSSCKKINESTELGGDLIPPIDNINTFDTTITVEAYNDLFTLGGTNPLLEDSTYSNYTDEQFLGVISNDPLFGKTDAQMYFELKPDQYKYTFLNNVDSLHLDSVVLVLDYLETYGDTSASQTINVYEISSEFRVDTSYLVRRNDYFTTSTLLGARTFKPENLKDSVKAYKDTTSRQLRIKLDNSFGQRLLGYDTAGTSGGYSSDSAFKTKFKGFALKSIAGGNAIMGFNLQGVNTKLAIYYRDDNGDSPKEDTTVAYFSFKAPPTYSLAGSASHNYIHRDYSGTPLLTAQGGTTPDPLVYIQNTPGTFARIKIPDLLNVSNRVIHRAELIAEQVYDPSDDKFYSPTGLMLDVLDTALKAYRYMPYDLNYNTRDGSNEVSFGVFGKKSVDGLGNPISVWKFNISRYVQNLLSRREPSHELRLFTSLESFDIYQPSIFETAGLIPAIGLNSSIATGRVRLAGGNYIDPTKKMRLRIVYSKL